MATGNRARAQTSSRPGSPRAEIIAVGTELLMGQVINTNAAEIAHMLAESGVGVYYQSVVGDNAERLAEAFTTALERADLVIACGGLGPTEDDLTRETLSHVVGRPLRRNEEWMRGLRARFSHSPGGELPRNNARQAMVPEGADLLPNSRGTAPGIYLRHGNTDVYLVPGPPHEMRSMMHQQVMPRLTEQLARDGRRGVLVSRVVRVTGIGESRVAELLQEVLDRQSNPTIAPLAGAGEVHLRVTAHAPSPEEATRRIDTTVGEIRSILGDAVYGEDDTDLPRAVGELLTAHHATVALAESCTGGLVGHRLTNAPGSSRYFLGGVVAYSYELKSSALGVDPEVLQRDGAVSDEVARQMGRGVRKMCGSDLAVAITGIAGPGGGTATKPVGLTYIAVVDASGEEVARHVFHGDREGIKHRASQTALDMLRRRLIANTAV
ncbi:MAG: competence/damage-inducible protein A [Alkalispirochaeta sp.]